MTIVVEDKNGTPSTPITFNPKNSLVVEDLPKKDQKIFENPKTITITLDKARNPNKEYNVNVKVHVCEKPTTTPGVKTTIPGTEVTKETKSTTPSGTATPPLTVETTTATKGL